jgi:ABC-type proline/glycine betaine transport system permease subunit
LSGNLDELPRGEVGELEGLHIVVREMSGWRKALLHLVMVLWFIAPLAITGTLIAIFHWESRLSGPIEILAGLVYTIWSLWGLVLFVRYLGEDTKTLVFDVFKTVAGRK